MKLRTMIACCCVAIVCMTNGCSVPGYRLVSIEYDEEKAITCYVASSGFIRLGGIRIRRSDGQWELAGSISGHWTSAYGTFRIEAVAADEALVFAGARRIRTRTLGVRRHREVRDTFHLPIPDPETFDHLHFAFVSSGDADKRLPAHERDSVYYASESWGSFSGLFIRQNPC